MDNAQNNRSYIRLDHELFTLPNGLRVVLSPDASAPVGAVVVLYDVGARNEPEGRTGFAHLFEHMMFQGSECVPKGEFFARVEEAGGVLNGGTSSDMTIYYESVPGHQVELALWLEADRMRALQVNQENLDNQRDVVKEEKRLRYDNQPYNWALMGLLYEKAFDNFANGHSVIGSMEDLDAASLEYVQWFWRTYYAPNNAILVVAGDIDAAQCRQWVETYYGGIAAQPLPTPPHFDEAGRTSPVHISYLDPLAIEPAVAVAWQAPPRTHPDMTALNMGYTLLAEGDASRLYQRLVKQDRSCSTMFSWLDARRGPSLTVIAGVYKSEFSAEQIEAAVLDEAERLAQHGPTEAEMDRIRNMMLYLRLRHGSVGMGDLQTPLGRAIELADNLLVYGDPAHTNRDIEQIQAVSAADVQRAVQRWMHPDQRTVLCIEPGASAAEGEDE